MKRTLKNILMIILILGFTALVYLTIEVAKGNVSLNNKVVINLEATVLNFNEQSGESSESSPDAGTEEITTETPEDETGEVITTTVEETEVDPATTVTNEDDVLYTTTDTTENDDENLIAEDALLDKSLDTTKEEDVAIIYYVVIAIECLVISLLLSYLAYSKFNKLTFKEVFSVNKMGFYYIAYSLLLAASILIALYRFLN